jgi:threonine synthase
LVSWYCPRCGFEEDFFKKYYWRCPRCGSPLEVRYMFNYETSGGRGLRRYASTLPLVPEKSRGEGSTPLVTEYIDGREILFKLEYLNPSGSFKDRGTSLAIYYAYKMGYRSIVEDTSGNTGISVALYSRLYNLSAKIIMPRTAPEGKKRIVKLLGAEVIETPTRSDAAQEVLRYIEGSYYVAHTWNPLYILGASTIAYEVFEEYGAPEAFIAPIGSGGLFLGLVRGFENLLRHGLIKRMPKIIGVQGYSTQPVYRALRGSEAVGEESTLADGIMVQNPPRLNEIVEVLKRYGGEVILVGNSEIREALNELVNLGFIVEPTSATVWAGYKKIREVLDAKSILLPLTGSGLKT